MINSFWINKSVLITGAGGYWMDLGRPDDYEKANEDFNNMKFQFLPED
jgi:NDP-sugar pyrophosphorylase family protein